MENIENAATHEEIAPPSQPQPQPQPIIKIGEALKQARLAQGLAVTQVANHLHLTPKVVEQIEADNYDLGRSLVFTRGYIRGYSKFVGLDVNQTMEAFDALHLPEHVSNLSSKDPLLGMKGKMFSVKTAVLVVLAVLAFMVILGWQMGDDETQKKQPTNSVISPYTLGNSMSMQSTPVVPPPVVVAQPADVDDLQAVAADLVSGPMPNPNTPAPSAGSSGIAATHSGQGTSHTPSASSTTSHSTQSLPKPRSEQTANQQIADDSVAAQREAAARKKLQQNPPNPSQFFGPPEE